MAVLGRGLVFKPVLVTQTCTYNSNNIITLQNIDITDFHHNNITTTLPPPPKKNKKKNPKPTTTKEATILANVLTCHEN